MARATMSVPLDDAVIDRVRSIAKTRQMTPEAYVAQLIDIVTQPAPRDEELGPITRRLSGALPPMTDDEIRNAVSDALVAKHGDTGKPL